MSTPGKRKVPLLGLPMKANTHLLDTKLFRMSVGGPLLLGLLLCLIALVTSWDELDLCGRVECFSTFFSIFKFQIGVMGASIPLGALVASQHRSVQTKEQIDSQWKQINAQEKQNIFSNHLSHRNHFNEFFEEFKPFGDANMFSKWEIYDSLFPSAPDGRFDANQEIFDLLDEIDDLTDCFSDLVRTHELSLTPDMKLRLIAFNSKAERLFGLSERIRLEEAVEMKANEVQKHLFTMRTIVLGLHSCLNFHKTHITYSVVQQLTQRLTKLANELETECRCERLANTILKCLLKDSFNLETTKENQELVEQSFKDELEKMSHNHAGEALDYDDLGSEARIVLEEYIPEEEKEKAIVLLPRLLRMIIS